MHFSKILLSMFRREDWAIVFNIFWVVLFVNGCYSRCFPTRWHFAYAFNILEKLIEYITHLFAASLVKPGR